MARTTARCVACGNIHSVSEMFKGNPLDRGGKPGYICISCANREEAYTCKSEEKGNAKSEKWTCSEEFETNNHSFIGHANLLHNGFVPSSDSSLNGPQGIEYKSPIYQGFGGLVKYQKSIEKMMNSGDLEADNSCGHHLHIGRTEIVNHLTGEIYDLNNEALDAIWKYAESILHPLQEHLTAYPEEARLIFGRPMHPTWAATLEEAVCRGGGYRERREHENRYCFINFCTEGKIPGRTYGKSPLYAKTIEFRINKFRNATQYSTAIMLEKAIVNAIIVNFLDYWQSGDNSQILAKQAVKTGNKLLSLFTKCTAKYSGE